MSEKQDQNKKQNKEHSDDTFFQTLTGDVSRLAAGAFAAVQAGKDDIEDWYWGHLEKRLQQMEMPTAKDWEAIMIMMKKNKKRYEALEKRLSALENTISKPPKNAKNMKSAKKESSQSKAKEASS